MLLEQEHLDEARNLLETIPLSEVAAEKHDLTLVSFDTDFDRTERGRKTPAEALEMLRAASGKWRN